MHVQRAALTLLAMMAMCAAAGRVQAASGPADGFPAGAAGSDESLLGSTDVDRGADLVGAGSNANDGEFRTPTDCEAAEESRFVGLRDTTFSVQLRSFYEDIDNFNLTESQAWTLGGLAGFKTGYFANFLALGATGYTSQALDAPLDRSGTKLLREDQKPYSVIGELYGQFRLTDEILATVGRRGFDTPFINTQDSFMTPNTFQVYSVTGVVGELGRRGAALRRGVCR